MAVKKNAKIFRKMINNFKNIAKESKRNPNDSDAGSELDTEKKIKYGSKSQAAWGIFSEYCDSSTIHGMKYLGEHRRPVLERLFWICVFILSIYTCTLLISNVWDKWNNNPVIVSFAEKSTPVWQIPFPAVTICPETKTRPVIFNFTDIVLRLRLLNSDSNFTEKENLFMEAVLQTCMPLISRAFRFGKPFANVSGLIQAMEETKLDFTETFALCHWRSYPGKCIKFHKILTEEGICYSFNGFDPKDRDETLAELISLNGTNNETVQWSLENGYSWEAGPDAYPHRALGAGNNNGLYLWLKGVELDQDNICRGQFQGFKIILHSPGEVPQVSEQFKPEIITTSNGLKYYEPKRRQCFFQKERYLRYFKVYTQANCELECLSNFTMKECGCVKFSMPSMSLQGKFMFYRHFSPGTINSPVCGAGKIMCIFKARMAGLVAKFEQSLNQCAEGCNCLPACTPISYQAEISKADYDYRSHVRGIKDDKYFEENPGIRISRLSIFFKEAQFLTSKRSELYGTTDFIANCGGLLGLFMGVSALSIVEVVYFCTVRLWTNLRMRRRKWLEVERLDRVNENGVENGMDSPA